jgi:anti-sigma regulatory factor (Ser/Thr protein kinase)
VSHARRQATGWLAERSGGDVDGAAVVLSELLTNALQHTEGPIRLRVALAGPTAHIEVRDETGKLHRTPAPDVNGGRGLVLVEGLSSAWGVRRDGPGKVVWAEVPTS